jgi:hypothetical protein
MKEITPIENKNLPDVKEAPPGIARTEQEAWQNILGTHVEVKPLPDSVTPEVRSNLERMGFGLRYVPALDLGNIAYLRERGVNKYLAELQQKYPKWKPFESLSDRERADHTVPRSLEKWYWEHVNDGRVAFPVLPGQWMSVETVDKPSYREKYARTPFAERLGFRDNRFNVSWTDAHTAIEREKLSILSDIGVSGRSVDSRFLEAIEWNLLGNREGWGKTNTSEWTNTEFRGPGGLRRRLIVGHSGRGGAAYVDRDHPDVSGNHIGFRAAIVLGS